MKPVNENKIQILIKYRNIGRAKGRDDSSISKTKLFYFSSNNTILECKYCGCFFFFFWHLQLFVLRFWLPNSIFKASHTKSQENLRMKEREIPMDKFRNSLKRVFLMFYSSYPPSFSTSITICNISSLHMEACGPWRGT